MVKVAHTLLLGKGDPKDVVCREAEERGVDIIVIGRRGLGKFKRYASKASGGVAYVCGEARRQKAYLVALSFVLCAGCSWARSASTAPRTPSARCGSSRAHTSLRWKPHWAMALRLLHPPPKSCKCSSSVHYHFASSPSSPLQINKSTLQHSLHCTLLSSLSSSCCREGSQRASRPKAEEPPKQEGVSAEACG